MKRLLIITAALGLTACNQTSTTPVDPLTQSFTATGKSSVTGADHKLYTLASGKAEEVGTLKSDGTVSVIISADKAKELSQSFDAFVAEKREGCDVSNITISDKTAKGFIFDTLSYNDKKNILAMGTITENDAKSVSFYFVDKATTVKGDISCAVDYNDDKQVVKVAATFSFDLDLKPGWNKISEQFNREQKDSAVTIKNILKSEGPATTYNGTWFKK